MRRLELTATPRCDKCRELLADKNDGCDCESHRKVPLERQTVRILCDAEPGASKPFLVCQSARDYNGEGGLNTDLRDIHENIRDQ